MKNIKVRLILLVLVAIVSFVYTFLSFPSLLQALPDWVKRTPLGAYLEKHPQGAGITLGLDLQGGIHLVLEVEEDRAVEIAVDRAVTAIQDELVEKRIPVESVKRKGSIQIVLSFQNAELKPQIQKVLEDFPSFFEVEPSSTAQGLVCELREAEIKRIKDSATNQALETIRNRIDQFGVAEPLIQRQGLKQIVVQLPGLKPSPRLSDAYAHILKAQSATSLDIAEKELALAVVKLTSSLDAGLDSHQNTSIKYVLGLILEAQKQAASQMPVAEKLEKIRRELGDLLDRMGPKRAKDLIKETALLEFKMLDESTNLAMEMPQRIPKGKEEEVLRQFQGRLPEGTQILFERVLEKDTGREYRVPYLVKKRVMLTGDVLSDARVSIGQFNEPYVSVTFDAKGAREFDRITAENVKKRMAIVLDNTVYSAPVIQERISGGRAQISGTFTMQEANDLAIVLRAGALPAPLKIIQDLTVGPTLGRDSIEKGIRSTLIAGAMVVLFMAIYYRLSGVIADFALALNLICLVGALSALNATLTLPGIAGIILTIGMGVDSNVLIFERIREELRQGRPVRLAIDGGYDKALLTIIDSHVTTLITGLALFLFGTGPIKGFAVTLCLGIAINLFTALVGTKVVFDIINQRYRLERLSI